MRAKIERICVTEEWVRRLSWIQEAMKTRADARVARSRVVGEQERVGRMESIRE